jgi:iron complex transport system substrate-binding protein
MPAPPRRPLECFRRVLLCWLALCCPPLPAVAQDAQAQSTPPRRVVSMNLCTDQLAMLIAAPGQLYSVSYLASQEDASALASEAQGYVANHGLAEEIFLMKPDLVLAGTFTSQATVALLKRLGFRVETFAPDASFADIRANLRRMGALLGRQDRAEELIATFDRALAEPQSRPKRALAAIYYPNSYTSGAGTLAGEVVERAGLENLAKRLGLEGTAQLPLEVLIAHAPDVIIGGERTSASHVRAYDNITHPALRALLKDRTQVTIPDKYWVCGGPFTAEAVRILAASAAGAAR